MGITYREAGVDIKAGDEFVRRIAPLARTTQGPQVLQGLGGFASLVSLPSGYREPVLVSATDGVGTKLKLATHLQRHHTIGIDLVAMCINDLITTGATPLFFLDYIAVHTLNPSVGEDLIRGIVEGCNQSGVALVGGETAEMPGLYPKDEYDLAGFAVGVVERDQLVDGATVVAGDALVALPSSGVHANGLSLARRMAENLPQGLDTPFDDGETIAEALLTPTLIYKRAVDEARKTVPIKAMCHVTGGGLVGNLPRVLPAHLTAEVTLPERPPVFDLIARVAEVADDEMLRTFNLGVGFVFVVSPDACGELTQALRNHGHQPLALGNVVPGPGPIQVVS